MNIPIKRKLAKRRSIDQDQLDAFPSDTETQGPPPCSSSPSAPHSADAVADSAESEAVVVDTVSSTQLERSLRDDPDAIQTIAASVPSQPDSGSSSLLALLSQVVDVLQSGELDANCCTQVAHLLCGDNNLAFNLQSVLISLTRKGSVTALVIDVDEGRETIASRLRSAVATATDQASPVHRDGLENEHNRGVDGYVLAQPVFCGGDVLGAISCSGYGNADRCKECLKVIGALIEYRLQGDVSQRRMTSLLNEVIITHHDLCGEIDQDRTLVESGLQSGSADPLALVPLYMNTPVAMLAVDRDGMIQHASRYALESLCYDEYDLVGKNISMLYANSSADAVSERLKFCLAEPDQIARRECGVRRGDGTWLQIRETIRFVADGDELFCVVLQDVTDTYRRSRELEYRATHDGLTGLVNRVEFERRLSEAIRAVSLDGASHTLCYLDLDHFKGINDSSGHNAGDEILKQLARIFVGQIRQSDTIARLGGDEFAVLMEFCTLENAQRLAEDLRRAVEEFEFEWRGRVFSASVSIGMTTIENADDVVADVMARADAACYTAKSAGRNQISVGGAGIEGGHSASPEIQRINAIERALTEAGFEIEVHSAISVDEQAEHETVVNQLSLRLWLDGVRLSAEQYMPAAEHAGLSGRVDEWLLDRVFKQLRGQSSPHEDVYLLSLSAATIYNSNFPALLRDRIEDSGINPATLCFACSESLLITAQAAVEKFIHEIRKLGCRLCISEMGSGFASFELIRDTDADYCSVAPAIVEKIGYSAVDLSILQAIISICEAAGIRTIVGSVNTDQQFELVSDLSTDYVQGDCVDQPRLFGAQ